MSDRIELCCHVTPAGDVCLMPPEWRAHQGDVQSYHPLIAHPYEPGVLVPLPLDLEAAEALLVQFVETVVEEGEMPRSEAMWNRTLDIAAALGVTE